MSSFRDSALYRVYWWMTSVKLTVVLLSIILLTLITGTIFEANRGTKAAQFLFYNSHWFDAIIIFFGFNLVCCTIRRFKRKISQIGFMTTHVGVMTILIGGLMSRNLKLDGQLIVPEGESRNYLLLDQNVLTATVEGPGGGDPIIRQYDTHYDKLGGRTRVNSKFRVPEAGIDLVVDQFYPDLRFEETLDDSSPDPNPALDMRALDWSGEHPLVLLARDPARRDSRTGTAAFSFIEVSDENALARELGRPGPETTRRLGVVEVVLTSGQKLEIPVDGGIERPFRPTRDPGVVVTVEAFFPDFALVGEQYSSKSTNLANPAVLLDVIGEGDSHERHLLFADHPDVDVSHREGGALTTKTLYTLPNRSTDAAGQVKLVRGPGGVVHYVAGGDGAAERRGIVTVGQAVSYPESGTRFWVSRVLEHAHFGERIWNGGREIKNPGIHITARDGRNEQAMWIVQGAPGEIKLGDRRVTVDYNFRRFDLGFSVMLQDFREITYPGISMAQSFESDVVVDSPDSHFSRKISMNNPLKFRGYKIFQSSFQRGEKETSIFSVARDPGVPVVYTGFFIFVFGLILIFFLKPYLVRWGAQRLRTAGGTPKAVAVAGGGTAPLAAAMFPGDRGGEVRAD